MSAFPPEILSGTSWAFRGERFSDRSAFDAAVREWQGDPEGWRPDEILPCNKLRVSYYGVGDDPSSIDYTQYVIELASDIGEPFTSLELLFKLHNSVVARLRDADHQYFEGLVLKEPGSTDAGPLYEMQQGS
jgi:hypothetical protein